MLGKYNKTYNLDYYYLQYIKLVKFFLFVYSFLFISRIQIYIPYITNILILQTVVFQFLPYK